MLKKLVALLLVVGVFAVAGNSLATSEDTVQFDMLIELLDDQAE